MSPVGLPPSNQIQAEAALWLVRLQSEERTEAQAAAFRDWLSTDPAHAVAFEAVNSTWDISAGLPRDMRGLSRKNVTSNRRHAMAGVATLLAGAGVVAFMRNAEARTFQTDVGEQKHISLDDGSRLFLDTDTRLVIRFSATQRTADLQQGRVNFRTAPDVIRPFIVNAEQTRLVASPSNLDVRVEATQLSVILISGSIDIVSRTGRSEKLGPGERVIIDANGTGSRDRPAMAPLLAWQTGQVVFEDGRLSDAASELNRYSNVKLVISDPEVGDFKVSGIYSVGDNLGFAASVAKLLPVKVLQQEGRIEIVPDRERRTRGL